MASIFEIADLETDFPLESSFDIHIGIVEDYADMFVGKMQKLGVNVIEGENGWEEWELERAQGQNDENTHHIILRLGRLQDVVPAAVDIAQRYIDILVPLRRQMVDETRNGIQVSVTLSGNWSEAVLDIYQTPSRTHLVKLRSQQITLPYK